MSTLLSPEPWPRTRAMGGCRQTRGCEATVSLAGGILGTSLRAPGARVFHGICGYCSKKEKISFQTKITGHTGSLEAAALCHSPRDLCKQGAGLQRRETGIAHAAPWQGAGSHAECCLSSLAQPCGEWEGSFCCRLGSVFPRVLFPHRPLGLRRRPQR